MYSCTWWLSSWEELEGERKGVRACAKILQTGRKSRKTGGWGEFGERMRMVARAGVGRVREGGGLARREGASSCQVCSSATTNN